MHQLCSGAGLIGRQRPSTTPHPHPHLQQAALQRRTAEQVGAVGAKVHGAVGLHCGARAAAKAQRVRTIKGEGARVREIPAGDAAKPSIHSHSSTQPLRPSPMPPLPPSPAAHPPTCDPAPPGQQQRNVHRVLPLLTVLHPAGAAQAQLTQRAVHLRKGGCRRRPQGGGGGGRAKTERDVSRVVRGRCTRPAAPCSVCGEQLAPRTLPLASQIPLPPPILHPSTPVSGRRRRCEARPPGSPPTRASQTRAGAPPGTAHRRTRRPHPGCLVLQQQRRRRRLHQTRAPSIALCLCRFHRTAQMAAPLAHSPMSGASTRSATSTRCSCVSSAGRKREAAAPASVRHRRSSCGQRRVGESEGGDARYAADWHATRPGQLPGQRKGRGGAGLTVGG